mmetsp:Transcript_71275/g.230843  ORF Transcript_71275/g.230843 Transcript_71275/m.230843 type:complete len:200 (+) Transcript_71275:619-1218(+)
MCGNVHRNLLAILDTAEARHGAHYDGALVAPGDEAEACAGGDVDGAVGAGRDVQKLDPCVWRPLEPRRLVEATDVHQPSARDSLKGWKTWLSRRVDLVIPQQALLRGLPQVLDGQRLLAAELGDGLRDSLQWLAERGACTEDQPKYVEVLNSDAGRLRCEREARDLQKVAKMLADKREQRSGGVPAAEGGRLRGDGHAR